MTSNGGKTKSITAWAGVIIAVLTIVVSVAVSLASKAEQCDLDETNQRVTRIEARAKSTDDELKYIRTRVDDIYDILRKDGK